MPDRIRWHHERDDRLIGCTGTLDPHVFVLLGPRFKGDEWVLMSRLPGQESVTRYAASPEALKPEAERLLAQFVTSLGAVFPELAPDTGKAIASEIERVIGGYPGNEATRPRVGAGEFLNDAQWAAKIAREWPVTAGEES